MTSGFFIDPHSSTSPTTDCQVFLERLGNRPSVATRLAGNSRPCTNDPVLALPAVHDQDLVIEDFPFDLWLVQRHPSATAIGWRVNPSDRLLDRMTVGHASRSSRAAQLAGKPSRSIPPRNTDISAMPASCNCCAVIDGRRSVLLAHDGHRPVITNQIGQVRRQFVERHVHRLSEMPERTGEFLRTSHIDDKRRGILPKAPRKRGWLNPRRRRRRTPKPSGQHIHGAILPCQLSSVQLQLSSVRVTRSLRGNFKIRSPLLGTSRRQGRRGDRRRAREIWRKSLR